MVRPLYRNPPPHGRAIPGRPDRGVDRGADGQASRDYNGPQAASRDGRGRIQLEAALYRYNGYLQEHLPQIVTLLSKGARATDIAVILHRFGVRSPTFHPDDCNGQILSLRNTVAYIAKRLAQSKKIPVRRPFQSRVWTPELVWRETQRGEENP